ncbi:MAG: HAD family hydrolase [Lachnospiraceae bacterium]|nr:HAD family hydrolase [Lachnospiraceae bacterium]
MKTYDAVSFDLFQTLVDVNQRIPQIWKHILKEDYTEKKAYEGATAVVSSFPDAYKQAVGERFLNMEEVYRICAAQAAEKLSLHTSAEQMAYAIMYEHGFSPFFEEVLEVLQEVKQKLPVFICSDASHLMADPIVEQLDLSGVYISDDLMYYKGDEKGRFFETVLLETKIDRKKILHIGDSMADIEGAKRSGMDACLIHRSKNRVVCTVKPDYQITNMHELLSILKN